VSQDRAVIDGPWAMAGTAGAAPPHFTVPAQLQRKSLAGAIAGREESAPGPSWKTGPDASGKSKKPALQRRTTKGEYQ
jgi:hypothetical protein